VFLSSEASHHQCFLFVFFISFLWLLNFFHWKIKWSVVCSSSSSSHEHIGLSVSPNLCKYDLNFPRPVTIVVNSGNMAIFCCSLFFTNGKKSFGHRPLPRIRPLLLPQMNSIFLLSCYNDLSWYVHTCII
jgi:hypothetical protein